MESIALFFNQHFMLSLGLISIFSLTIGSFLNVVVHRLPIMMKREWDQQCHEYLKLPFQTPKPARFNLFFPASHCPHCQATIKPWHNIPIFGYLILAGKCANCSANISSRYFAIEIFTAVLSVLTLWQIGLNFAGVAALILTWGLIALAFIDMEHQILPDVISLPLLWLGLLVNLNHGGFVYITDAILGVVAGYLSLWIIAHGFKLITHKDGMGHGDFKLLALLGAWMGWKLLPLVLVFSSLCGAMTSIFLIACKLRTREQPIPFGPYLAMAGWITLLWGEPIKEWYLHLLVQASY